MLETALIVGVDSQLGCALADNLRSHAVSVIGTSRRGRGDGAMSLDLADDLDTWQPPHSDWAVLCAAQTSIAVCERDPLGTRRINVDAPAALGTRLVENGTHVVFLSTNLVFDGTRPCQLATDEPRPACVYGRHKADAEKRLLQLGGRVAVLRLTKVLSRATPLLHEWAEALDSNRPVEAFCDVVLAPVLLSQVVQTIEVLGRAHAQGIFQLSGDRDISYAELACSLARARGADTSLVRPTPGARRYPITPPAHTTLDSSTLETVGVRALSTRDTIDRICNLN